MSGDNDVHAFQIVVHGPNGQGFTFTKKFYSDPEALKEAAQTDINYITQILQQGTIIVPTAEGPRKVSTVAEFFANLGIVNISASGVSGEVQGKVVVAAKPRILLSS